MEEFGGWLSDNGWTFWIALSVVLGLVETMTLDLVFLMLAGGAVAGAVAGLLGAPFALQALVASGAAVSLLVVVRPIARRHLEVPHHMKTGTAALPGQRAVVVEEVSRHGGQVKLVGEVWTARAYDETQVIPAGTTVDVIEVDGATVLVYSINETGE
jgi:membrane protein implicated in regulation of membrane protease activity